MIPLFILITLLVSAVVFDAGYWLGARRERLQLEAWKKQAITMRQMWVDEQEFFAEAINLAGRYKGNLATLRQFTFSRLTHDEKIQVTRLTEIAELEHLITRTAAAQGDGKEGM